MISTIMYDTPIDQDGTAGAALEHKFHQLSSKNIKCLRINHGIFDIKLSLNYDDDEYYKIIKHLYMIKPDNIDSGLIWFRCGSYLQFDKKFNVWSIYGPGKTPSIPKELT